LARPYEIRIEKCPGGLFRVWGDVDREVEFLAFEAHPVIAQIARMRRSMGPVKSRAAAPQQRACHVRQL
jgi:hypothetical protein